MPPFLRGPSRSLAPLSAAVALLAASSAFAEEAPQAAGARVAAPAASAPAAGAPASKPDAPASNVNAPASKSDAPASAADAAVAAPATAEAGGKKEESPWDAAHGTHRSGFVVGLALGSGVAAISGFPNDSRKIGLERYYTETGTSLSGMSSLWFGGAFTDWFTFGVGFSGTSMPLLSEHKASTGGLIFHIELYPLFPLGGRFRDAGVMLDAGTGSAAVTPKDSDRKLVDSGSASLIGGGPFYEGFKLWKIKHGPFIEGSYLWSDSVRRPAVFFGWRASLYTGIK